VLLFAIAYEILSKVGVQLLYNIWEKMKVKTHRTLISTLHDAYKEKVTIDAWGANKHMKDIYIQ
jgi:hypothetical protein